MTYREYHYAPTPVPSPRSGWWDTAACRGEDPSRFFPDAGRVELQDAIIEEFCDHCPVATKAACLADDLAVDGPRWGIRGGLSAAERTSLLRKESLPTLTRRTECRQGHPYTADNTSYDSRGHRECRTCRREARERAKHKEMVA